ncbi:helix-turn-helix domain-containing protein [Nocardioides nanhaiensis]|uniref:Helix-turn-helix domain-containing protein n=1 Tax=Nocardioides nanhaiensis TaxID=1476871 RepID=A0ABP8X1E2_9ACTN
MRVLTEAEVAEILAVSPARAAAWRLRYGWPHVRIGNQIRYTEAQLEAVLTEHTVLTPADQREPRVPGALPGQTARSARYWEGRR